MSPKSTKPSIAIILLDSLLIAVIGILPTRAQEPSPRPATGVGHASQLGEKSTVFRWENMRAGAIKTEKGWTVQDFAPSFFVWPPRWDWSVRSETRPRAPLSTSKARSGQSPDSCHDYEARLRPVRIFNESRSTRCHLPASPALKLSRAWPVARHPRWCWRISQPATIASPK